VRDGCHVQKFHPDDRSFRSTQRALASRAI
jgi:hypothetical protein